MKLVEITLANGWTVFGGGEKIQNRQWRESSS